MLMHIKNTQIFRNDGRMIDPKEQLKRKVAKMMDLLQVGLMLMVQE